MIDLDAIAKRDSVIGRNPPRVLESCDLAAADRRALLAYVRLLIAAARKVRCRVCDGDSRGVVLDQFGNFKSVVPCPSCSALRALLPEVTP